MPKYGNVNERRNQLHEVIRLSGMNIPIDDNDHPLIIKVASLQPSRIQAYFIDNDDYFQREDSDQDIVGSNRPDNDERSVFFARGTVETVKKLRWDPSLLHAMGWMTAMTPFYMRTLYKKDPAFAKTKIVYTVTDDKVNATLDPSLFDKLAQDGIKPAQLAQYRTPHPDTDTLHRMAVDHADAVIFDTDSPSPLLLERVKERGIPYATKQQMAAGIQAYKDIYNSLLENGNE